jgi:hypothetical protein
MLGNTRNDVSAVKPGVNFKVWEFFSSSNFSKNSSTVLISEPSASRVSLQA